MGEVKHVLKFREYFCTAMSVIIIEQIINNMYI